MEALNKNVVGEMAVASRQFKKEENYWLKKFSGKLVKSIIPGDYPRVTDWKHIPETINFKITNESFSRLMKLSGGSDPKLHMILVTVLIILLEKYSENQDIVMGTPIYKQDTNAEFINTVLALRQIVTKDVSFKELLLEVRNMIIEADSHQNYSIDLLLQKLKIPYAGGDFPLFDTALLVENIQYKKYLSHLPLNIVFSFLRTGESIDGELEYNASIYKMSTAKRIAGHYTRILESVLQAIDKPLMEIDLLSPLESQQLLVEFNSTDAPYPRDKTLHQSFLEQAEKTPNNTAILFQSTDQEQVTLSYRDLDRQSNQLARYLKKQGASKESIIGIMMERSPGMVKAMMAILKAGGAYLPIDPGLPLERVTYMLKNSGAKILLTDSSSIGDTSFTDLQGLQDLESRFRVTPARSHIKEFDNLPMPDRSHLDLRNYKNKIGMASVTNCISLQSTRGCPYECLYCHKIWSKKHVHRSPENIFNEIEYYYKNGVTNFAVIDDCFNLNIQGSQRLFKMIIKNRLKIQIFFPNGLRGDIMTPDYIDRMIEAGTRGINLSLETASPRLQKLLKKNLDLDKFKQVVAYIATKHPNVILEMATMHGFPSETEEEAMMTLNFIKDIKWLHFPYIHILKIFPNTEMEEFALENGISKADIMASRDRAFHELPETLPFPKSFTRKYQADFLNEYFLSKQRLSQVLPVQMGILSEEALAQKYNAYLPTEISNLHDIIEFTGLEGIDIPDKLSENSEQSTIFDRPYEIPAQQVDARRVLFLDLSQHFSSHSMLYRVVEQPLGELYLLTYLKERFGDRIQGRVFKSGNDFDSFDQLRLLLEEFKPELIGIRALTFFKEFFHETAALIRQWGFDVPIITGGPYASSDYDTILKDNNITMAILGEGEYTLAELIDEMLKNDFRVPKPDKLERIRGIAYPNHRTENQIPRQVLVTDRITDKIAEEDSQPLKTQVKGSNLAYVMYTSGSTGKPKGVMVEHRQVQNCISWMQEKFQLTEADVIVQRTNLTFDPSVWEIFWPLAIGGGIKLLSQQQSRDAEYLIELMATDTTATMMYCPASLVTAMTYLMTSKSKFTDQVLKIPWLITGAEPISMEVVKELYNSFEGKIVNTYGPTECTINNTYYDLDRDDPHSVVPIGSPVANNKIYILSTGMKLQPVNKTGEICITGDSLARGYINNEQATEMCFIDNPFGSGKLYKTGDVGRWLEDGSIEIMGRTDEQVKIRGYRIELGEIKSALMNYEAIADCVVTTGDMNEKRKQLNVRACKKCGITTEYPGIVINDEGICGVCINYAQYKEVIDAYFKSLDDLKNTISEQNKTKTGTYDCMILYSGGRGAAHALYRLKDMGFNILAATYDNGYMGQKAMDRIKMITSGLNIDHVVLSHENTDKILVESMKSAHTVCRGCFLTSSSLAAQYAFQNDINVVVGATLSRGQIIENRLLMFLQQGITKVAELEDQILKFQKSIAEIEKNTFNLLDIDVVNDGSIYKTIKFIDFYRYCDISNEDMIQYLNDRDPYWKTKKNYSIYSTNCPIKQIGDYGHLKERGYHFYGGATSWEKRLGHLSLKNIKEDLQCNATQKGYENFLKHIEYDIGQQVQREDKYLCAYYVLDPGNGEEPHSNELREHLQRKLPEYMIPNHFIALPKIPLTANGKLDRHALPHPATQRSVVSANYVAPETGIEKLIAKLWADVLQLDRIGINDNFFELGGNSLNIIEVNSKLQVELDMDIPVVTMFTYTTINKLAQHLSQDNGKAEKKVQAENEQQKELITEGKNMMKQAFGKMGG